MSTFTLAKIAEALRVSKQAVSKRAERECWSFSEVSVRGGKQRLFSPESLPKEVREALLLGEVKRVSQNLPVAPQASCAPVSVALAVVREADLTDAQRAERDARVGVLAAIKRFQTSTKCSQQAAMTALLAWAASGQADEFTVKILRMARDPRGRAGNGLPSVRTLKRWLAAEKGGSTALAPKAPRADMSVPVWADVFLRCYRQPQKPSVEDAYRVACDLWGAERPSIHQVRRFLAKLGTVTREAGRMGERELKNIRPFVRRDFSELQPNDIWTGDGHTFDAEVQHPLHGRPFRPEITTFIDIATRRAVGWSVGLAESSWAVADALRWGIERNGVFAMLYVDNGSGYRNAFMSDEATGLAGRIGATITHSLPYNSQARGVIERAHQTIWVAGAKLLPSYMGAEMDRQARLEQFKLTRKALKHGGVMPLMPWDLFIQFCQERIDAYNASAHRSLKGLSPDLVLRNFVARGWAPHELAAGELETLFRPRTTRTVARGELQVMNNRYFSRELEEFHGTEVHVAYDIHDASKVWVYLPDGRLICTAEVNGNSRHYFPVPVVEQARQKRADGRLARVEAKREEILAERNGALAITAQPTSTVVIGGRVINPAEALAAREAVLVAQEVAPELPPSISRIQPAPARSRSDMSTEEVAAEWAEVERRLRAEEPVSEQDRNFYRRWPESAQGRMWFKRQNTGT